LKGRIRQQNAFDFLRHASGSELFDIVFADPPYEKTEDGERFTEKLLANGGLLQLMDADGIFVLEKRSAEALPQMKQWHLVHQKTYGATEVLFLSGVRNQKFEIRN
jgi:16S rRNA G966 N2-methylase RsmD